MTRHEVRDGAENLVRVFHTSPLDDEPRITKFEDSVNDEVYRAAIEGRIRILRESRIPLMRDFLRIQDELHELRARLRNANAGNND